MMRIALDAIAVYARTCRGAGKNPIGLYRTIAKLRPNWDSSMRYQTNIPNDLFLSCSRENADRLICLD
jgi:hypothetical protein